MIALLLALGSLISFRLRSRASLELEVIALRHQIGVLRRQRPGRVTLLRADKVLWAWLYRIWPQVLTTIVLVKPATVVGWHRQVFRFCWRWRSKSHLRGRSAISAPTRDLIRQMSTANPLWGAPRIHGELLKLGIEISQASVDRYMPWRSKTPSPTWRSFLHNHMTDTVALDMFVVVTANFRLLYTMIALTHDRRKIIHIAITSNPTQFWLARQLTEAFPWETAPRYLLRDRDGAFGQSFRDRVRAMSSSMRSRVRQRLIPSAQLTTWWCSQSRRTSVIAGAAHASSCLLTVRSRQSRTRIATSSSRSRMRGVGITGS